MEITARRLLTFSNVNACFGFGFGESFGDDGNQKLPFRRLGLRRRLRLGSGAGTVDAYERGDIEGLPDLDKDQQVLQKGAESCGADGAGLAGGGAVPEGGVGLHEHD